MPKGGNMLTEQQIKDRKNAIGGSDCAGVLGLSRWSSPLTVWMDKTGQATPKETNIAMKMGNKLEQAVAELFMEETGKKVHRVNQTKYHKDYPFIAANLDRMIVGQDAILECKTARSGKEWKDDEIPLEYIYQCYHYMAVEECPIVYLAVLIGNSDFKIKELVYDKKIIDEIVAKEVHFWKTWVEPRVMPDVITSIDGDILSEIYGITPKNETIIQVSDDTDAYFKELQDTQFKIKELEKAEKEFQNKLKSLIGENTGIKTSKYQLKWTEVPETPIEAYTRKAYRKLSPIKEIKNG